MEQPEVSEQYSLFDVFFIVKVQKMTLRYKNYDSKEDPQNFESVTNGFFLSR